MAERDALRLTEFFNASIGRVITLGGELSPTSAVNEARVTASGDVVIGEGAPPDVRWVVAPRALGVVGTPVATGTTSGLVLIRTDGRLRVRRSS